MENFEKNLKTETVEKTRYVWTCPKCEKTIPGPTEKKVKSAAGQHNLLKHNEE